MHRSMIISELRDIQTPKRQKEALPSEKQARARVYRLRNAICVTLDKLVNFLSLHFLMCKVWTIVAPHY